MSDVEERGLWDEYMQAYEDALTHTSAQHAPWYGIPADHRWFSAATAAEIIVRQLQALKLG